MNDNKILDVTVYINKTHSFITLYCKYFFCFMFNFLLFVNFCRFSEKKVTRVNIVLVFLIIFYHFLKIYTYYNGLWLILAYLLSFSLTVADCVPLCVMVVYLCLLWLILAAYGLYLLTVLILTLCGSKLLLVTPCGSVFLIVNHFCSLWLISSICSSFLLLVAHSGSFELIVAYCGLFWFIGAYFGSLRLILNYALLSSF